jgi:hypothetical protein
MQLIVWLCLVQEQNKAGNNCLCMCVCVFVLFVRDTTASDYKAVLKAAVFLVEARALGMWLSSVLLVLIVLFICLFIDLCVCVCVYVCVCVCTERCLREKKMKHQSTYTSAFAVNAALFFDTGRFHD